MTAPEELAPFAARKLRLDLVDSIPKALLQEDAEQLDIDRSGKIIATELNLSRRPSNNYEEFSQRALIDALSRGVRDKRISHDDMGKVIRRTVQSLEKDGWTVSAMFGRFRVISEALSSEMRNRYAQYLLDGFRAARQQGKLVTSAVVLPAEVLQRNENYSGLDLRKHAYPETSSMNNDELKIAQDLTRSDQVSWWWRNPDRTGWAIVGHWGRFYPDFLARLTDGRTLVIEYKGKQLAGAEDTERKVTLGGLWADVAGHGAEFYLVTRDPDAGDPHQLSPGDLCRNILGLTT